ncbi:MAG: PTS sugar transporter subunit IIA [Candidatus Aminicenantaceae bacterium]
MHKMMFGHTLRMLRTTAGISLRTLAKKMDVSPAYLSQVELGKLNPPTYDRITKIAEAIGIPVSLLIEMSHRPNPDTIMLLQRHQELNELILLTSDIGLESRDIFKIIALMRKLGGSGFRKLMQYGEGHSSDFKSSGRGEFSTKIPLYPINHMAFSELANHRLVFMRLEFTEKSDLLRYMIEKISILNSKFDLDGAHKKLMSREAEDSSGLGNGVAVPHLFLDELDQTVIAIARIPKGIDFNAIDNKPVHLVCLILSHPEFFQSHLNLLAHFARKFQIPEFLDEILKAGSKKSILSRLFDGDDTSMH